MSHHDPHEIAHAFQVDPYRTQVWSAQDETVVDYYDEDRHIAHFVIRLLDDGGTAWTRAWVTPDYQGQGIYTHLHKWALTQPSSVILAEGDQTDLYVRSGYEEVSPGVLEIRKTKSKKWLKGR